MKHYGNNANLEALLLNFLELRRESQQGWVQDPPQGEDTTKEGASLEAAHVVAASPFAPEYYEHYFSDFAHHIMGEVLSVLMPHAIQVLNEQEFPESTIFHQHITREQLAQLVDTALRSAATHPDVGNSLSQDHAPWGTRHLMRAIMEALIIFELYYRRKPIYKRLQAGHDNS